MESSRWENYRQLGNGRFFHVAAQLGHDLFNGEGWEAYDRGEKNPPQPENWGAMGIKFLKKSKPESERVEDDAKVRTKLKKP